MKYEMTTNLFLRASAALVLALTLQSTVPADSPAPMKGKTMMSDSMMEHCKTMKEEKLKMKEEMKAQDAQLTALLASMNSAPEKKKVDAMAAVVNLMANQRIALHAQKIKMEEDMMNHMKDHMQMGKGSMSNCPMMQGMMDDVDTSTGTHTMPPMEQK